MARTKQTAKKTPIKNQNHDPNQDTTPSLEEIDKIVAEVEAETSGKLVDAAAKDAPKAKKEKHDSKTMFVANLVKQVQ
eukprot:1470567-Pyramimonas_sp.AAC.1